jgi:putative glycosyltransferase (TIGR04372 family)
MILPVSVYFSFQWLDSSGRRRLLMQVGGILLLPVAALLWLLPFRLACFNMRAFGHLCLEPYLLRIDESVRARVFALAGGAVANRALYDFLKTRYPVIEDRWLIGLLATLYSWRFLQVDVGRYFYSQRRNKPEYTDVLARYCESLAAEVYREDFKQFVNQLVPSGRVVDFISKFGRKYAVAHWRLNDSMAIHQIRNSRGQEIIDSIRLIRCSGYGVCIVGEGYEKDPSYDELSKIEGVFFSGLSDGADPKEDLWFLANANFGLFGESGISAVTALLAKPAVVHNFVPQGLGPLHFSWVFLRKKFRWKDSKGCVSLDEIQRLNLDYIADWRVCQERGIEVVDCASEEIKAAVCTLVKKLESIEVTDLQTTVDRGEA